MAGALCPGFELLYQPEVVRLYLSLLTESRNFNTLEAAAGALQNLSAGNWMVRGQVWQGGDTENPRRPFQCPPLHSASPRSGRFMAQRLQALCPGWWGGEASCGGGVELLGSGFVRTVQLEGVVRTHMGEWHVWRDSAC